MLTMCLIIIVSTKSKLYTYKQYEVNTKDTYGALILHTRVIQVVEIKVKQLRATKWSIKVMLSHVVNYTWAMTYRAVT